MKPFAYIFRTGKTLLGILAILLIAGSALIVNAQEVTGSLLGTVRDSNGGAIANATVTITDAEKKVVVRTVTTNTDGQFSAPLLQSGLYDISVEAKGFKKQVERTIKLDLNQRRTIDMVLEVGAISDVVTVESSPVAVESTTPTSSSLISGDQVRELSLNNRNWVQLVTLSPGVSNDLADQVYVGTTNPSGQANTVNISVNGARSSQNTFTVDGADVTDRGSNITIQAYPSVDSIGEIKVLRSLYPAESGRSGGGQVNVITRSGGSQFHGSAYEFLRNEVLNANDYLTNSTLNPAFGRTSDGKAKRPPFRYNNFGWTLGGPILLSKKVFGPLGWDEAKERLHFFFAQEYRRDRRAAPAATVTVPDENLRKGVFPFPVCINRPLLGEAACTGNFILPANTPIPANVLSPTALAYINGIYNKLPLPNSPSITNPFGLVTAIPNIADFRQEVLKIDYTFSPRWNMYYRYQHDAIPTTDGNALFSSGSGLPGVSTTKTDSPGKTHTFQTTFTINPKLLFEGRYNYGYGAILSQNVGTLALTNTKVPITLPYVSTRDRVPTITGNGFTGLTSFGPYDNFSYKHNFNGSLTGIFGNHTVKVGGVYSIYRKNENALAGNNEGIFNSFSATIPTGLTFPQNYVLPNGTVLAGALTATVAANLQRWANFLVGNSTGFTQSHYDYTADLRQKAIEAYGQDEYRVKNNLTLYYGVRYSYFPSPYDKNGRLSNFDPALYSASNAPAVTGAGNRIAGTGNYCNGIIVNSQNFQTGPAAFNCTPTVSPYGEYVINVGKKDFAPRLGLAWDPFKKGKTAIRTGYGIYHEQVLVGTFEQNIGANPPYQETVTGSSVRLDSPGAAIVAGAGVQSLRAIQTDWHTPYTQHWSLDVQQQLSKSTLVTVGYYGSKATHLIGITELNEVPPGKALSSSCAQGANYIGQTPAPTLVQCQPAGYAFRNSSTATGNPNAAGVLDLLILDQLRPYRGFRSIAIIQPRYNSNYHSLQVSAQHRFSRSSSINLAYTWAKNLTDSQNDRSASPQNTYDIRSEYARAALDRRQILTISYIYQLPFYRTQQGFAGKVLGGWQVAGITSIQTGLPFTATTSNLDYAGVGLINTNPTARPNLLCDPNSGAPQTAQQFFNTACFQTNPTTTATGLPTSPGTAGRGVINGPGTKRFDFTLSRTVKFTENVRLQLRGEVFNIFNHTNFRGFTSTNVTSTAFGQIGTVRDPRTMQMGIKLLF
ncbi:MAG TPA: carboxypeptidase regulatory-like domain-containing protein [Blastocatellia bacterium]|nr:carboxypeptidase regulatory-like domain-containing protein [Blastocatellia bacterium]